MVRQRATVPKCLGGTPPPEKLLSTDSDAGACGRGWRGQSGPGARRRHGRFESGAKFPGRASWAGPGGGMLVLPRGGVGSAGPRSSSYPVSPMTAALEVGAWGLRWTGALAAAESLLTLAGPSALAGCSQAGMTKPGGLKLIHLSPWVYDDQSLSARNSFARTPQLLNAYTQPFSCPSPPPKLSSPAWPDARLASVPWGWLSAPQKNSLSVSGGPSAPGQGWPGA